MKRTLLFLLVPGVIGGAGFAYYTYTKTDPPPTVATSVVTRGDVVDTVGATGTLQAVTTVQVGTQVSGTIQALYADFNSLVRKGQVLARLDPSLFETQIEQARANLIRAEADLDRLRVSLEDARTKLTRAEELSGRQLIPQSELETAQVNVRSIQAQIRSSEAQVTQARASLNQNQVNLQHTVITAPIDGLVISRNVDVGQTVAASMQAPTLFVLAADLTKMQVVANLDESDVGRIRPGQQVAFRVDAYPADEFVGSVVQVRLQPIVQQNVVTYATVIEVPNPGLKLKPGMTANVNIEINRRTNVVRLPNAALRFRPTNEIFAALGQTPPDPSQLRAPFGPPRPRPAAPLEPVAAPPAGDRATGAPRPDASQSDGPVEGSRRGGFAGRGTGGGRGGFGERLQGLSPEERDRILEQMRGRGFDPSAASGAPGDGTPGRGSGRGRGGRGETSERGEAAARAAAPASPPQEATTFDALFAPLPPVESVGRIWLHEGNQLRPVTVRLGVSDGQNTELLEGDVPEGAELVTSVVVAGSEARPAAGGGFPFPTGGGFGGGRGGGGGGRGR